MVALDVPHCKTCTLTDIPPPLIVGVHVLHSLKSAAKLAFSKARVAERGHADLHIANESLDDESHVLGWNTLNALLNHMVAVLVQYTAQHVAIKLSCKEGKCVSRMAARGSGHGRGDKTSGSWCHSHNGVDSDDIAGLSCHFWRQRAIAAYHLHTQQRLGNLPRLGCATVLPPFSTPSSKAA